MFMNSRHSLRHSFCSPKFNCHVGPSSRRWCDNIDYTCTLLCFLLIDRTSVPAFLFRYFREFEREQNRDIEMDFYNYEITSARGSHFEKMFRKTADKIETSTY